MVILKMLISYMSYAEAYCYYLFMFILKMLHFLQTNRTISLTIIWGGGTVF